ncbi:hypothetical protein KZY66_09955 [Prevotella salivae]|uniref:hypothetical protein n=1 Tax=Segatella salivae TaxID=228604 RepID=UPI001C5FDA48|nr:hypothetical protein [Segatella salivae]MBW4907598.1 hypothetical protein [Segatella salivae]
MIHKTNHFVKFISVIWYSFMRALPKFISWNKRFNAIGIAVSIAQGYQTIVWATLGEHVVCREQRRKCCAFSE